MNGREGWDVREFKARVRRIGRVAALCALCVPGIASSEEKAPEPEPTSPAEMSADQIVSRLNARREGEVYSQLVELELEDRRGRKRVREMWLYRKSLPEGERRTVVRFVAPPRVDGTGLLVWDFAREREDLQWLYLPAVRQVRRIGAADRGDSFFGTDLTYEEIKKGGKIEAHEFEFEREGSEEIDGHPCAWISATPKTPELAQAHGYGRVRLCVDPEIWMVRKSEMWDLAGERLKTIWTRAIRPVDDIWTAHEVEAVQHQSGHRTRFIAKETDYKTELPESMFTEAALRRPRLP